MAEKLTAEAFGTLLALAELGRIRTVQPRVASELIGHGFAEHAGGALLVTAAGRQFAETREIGQALGFAPSRSRRRSCG
jgi:hypothetical protein